MMWFNILKLYGGPKDKTGSRRSGPGKGGISKTQVNKIIIEFLDSIDISSVFTTSDIIAFNSAASTSQISNGLRYGRSYIVRRFTALSREEAKTTDRYKEEDAKLRLKKKFYRKVE